MTQPTRRPRKVQAREVVRGQLIRITYRAGDLLCSNVGTVHRIETERMARYFYTKEDNLIGVDWGDGQPPTITVIEGSKATQNVALEGMEL